MSVPMDALAFDRVSSSKVNAASPPISLNSSNSVYEPSIRMYGDNCQLLDSLLKELMSARDPYT